MVTIQQQLEKIPSAGRAYVREALLDPSTRNTAMDILLSFDPADAATRQADKDIKEFLNPTGRTIVFKRFASTLGPRIKAAEDAVVRAANPATEEGRIARAILAESPTPQRHLTEFYTMLAINEVAPEVLDLIPGDEEAVEGLAGLDGFSLKKIFKKVASKIKKVVKSSGFQKFAKIAAGVVAAPALIPGLSAALGPAVGAMGNLAGGVSGGITSMFGGTSALPGIAQVATATTGLPVSQVVQAATTALQPKVTTQTTLPAITVPGQTITVSAQKAAAPAEGIPTWAYAAGGGLAFILLLAVIRRARS